MGTTTTAYGSITVDAETIEVAHAATVESGHYAVRLTTYVDPMMVYVDGTLDELAQFVADLAGVVRELSARELATDGSIQFANTNMSDRKRCGYCGSIVAPIGCVEHAGVHGYHASDVRIEHGVTA